MCGRALNWTELLPTVSLSSFLNVVVVNYLFPDIFSKAPADNYLLNGLFTLLLPIGFLLVFGLYSKSEPIFENLNLEFGIWNLAKNLNVYMGKMKTNTSKLWENKHFLWGTYEFDRKRDTTSGHRKREPSQKDLIREKVRYHTIG